MTEKIQMVVSKVRSQESAQRPQHAYRVLMIAPTSFFSDYGCHVRILEETRILHQLGHRVTVVTYRNGQDVDGVEICRTLPIPWRRHYEVGSSRHKIAFDLLLGLKTAQLLATRPFDVIHGHLHEGALLGLGLGRLFRVPTLFDFQGSLTEEMIDHHFLSRQGRLYRSMRRLESWIDRQVPMILTSNAQAERLLVEQFGCHAGRVQTLSDRVNTDVFVPAARYHDAELVALRRTLGIPEDRKVIVYLGLLAAYQGTGLLLQAVQRILQQGQNVHLLLMGFPGVGQYRLQARELGIEEQVTLTGRIPYVQAPRFLALGDVAVAPKMSLTEGAGKLLNYMAVGLPTVAFDTPVAREYLGLDGYFAVKGDVASLAARLGSALASVPDGRNQGTPVGRRLRQRAMTHFGWEEAGRQIVAAYGQLTGRASVGTVATADWAVTRK